jgi:hypothetical protein
VIWVGAEIALRIELTGVAIARILNEQVAKRITVRAVTGFIPYDLTMAISVGLSLISVAIGGSRTPASSRKRRKRPPMM